MHRQIGDVIADHSIAARRHSQPAGAIVGAALQLTIWLPWCLVRVAAANVDRIACQAVSRSTRLHWQVAGILCDYLHSLPDADGPVVRLADPSKLRKLFDQAGAPLRLADTEASASTDELLAAIQATLRYSVRTGHPKFFNQLYARADPAATAADWLVTAANTNVHTYEAAPVFTAVEVRLDSLGCDIKARLWPLFCLCKQRVYNTALR